MEAIKKMDVIKQAELSTAKRLGIKEGLLKGRQEGRQEGVIEGLQKGRQEGLLEGKLEIIKSMIRAGYSYEQVKEITPLTKGEYDILIANLES